MLVVAVELVQQSQIVVLVASVRLLSVAAQAELLVVAVEVLLVPSAAAGLPADEEPLVAGAVAVPVVVAPVPLGPEPAVLVEAEIYVRRNDDNLSIL